MTTAEGAEVKRSEARDGPEHGDARGERRAEHFDVVIVGAGLSGIGAAYYLHSRLPGQRYAILEGREAIGGTWDLFRYPGVRSDSDMQTLGYRFRPWRESVALADGPSVLRYIRQTARENGIESRIRFGHRVVRARWSSDAAWWTVDAVRVGTGEPVSFTCRFLLGCSGYYRYDEGYRPKLEGVERFRGRIVHPQFWPEDLDYAGQRVVVIGSGATAVTLVPAMAPEAAHVTMLQRSPSYVLSIPGTDPIAGWLARVLPERLAHPLTRWKNIVAITLIYQISRRRPELVKRLIRSGLQRALPAGFDVDTHFKPRYDPWEERMCFVPDGDLLEAISAGRASMVTDQIETLTETGIQLAGGEELTADVIVTATGLNLLAFGGVELEVDGEAVRLPERFAYKGMMLSGVPNFAFCVGYTNASWTLKVDLVCEYICRLLAHMDAHGYDLCVPEVEDPEMPSLPLLDFAAGYVQRSIDAFPRQGPSYPWRMGMIYLQDAFRLRHGRIEDGALRFRSGARGRERERRSVLGWVS